MKNIASVIFLSLVCLSAALFTACPSNKVTTLAKSSDSIAIINQGFQAAAQTAHEGGLISAQEDIQLQLIVKQVAAINDNLANAYVEAEANNAKWVADVDTALTLGANLNAQSLLFVKNPTERATLTAIIVGIRSTLDNIAVQVRGVKLQ